MLAALPQSVGHRGGTSIPYFAAMAALIAVDPLGEVAGQALVDRI
jgi:hypothetical protein